MEEIYVNDEFFKSDKQIPSTINPTGPSSSKRRFYSGFILSLGLLSVFLMVGLVITGIYLHDSTASLSAISSKLSSMTEERNDLQDRLTNKTEELERLQSLLKQNKTCPAGWRMFCCSCYLLSGSNGSWDSARKDCRDRGADLVVINSPEEQDFLSTFIKTWTWIGLSDTQEEGKWKWVDGTPLTQTYWSHGQPDSGGGDPKYGEEDCAEIRKDENALWNDLSCGNSLPWVCEKVP